MLSLAPSFAFVQDEAPNATTSTAESKSDALAPTDEEKSELVRIKQTLQFGTDAAAVESIKTLSNMGLSSLAPTVLERMRSTKNEKVLTQAFTYLRDVGYTEALDFVISYVSDFQDYPVRAVQFAFFYLQDSVDALSDEMRTSLQEALLRILEDNNPTLSITALNLLPRYYSEEDEPYYGDAFFEDEPVVNVETAIQNIPRDIDTAASRLLSQRLITAYETIFTPAVQDEIIGTLGKIKAYNALPFILELANDDARISQSRRSAVIIALGSFELSGDLFNLVRKRRFEVFENARTDPSPKIRKALFESLHMHGTAQGVQAATPSSFVPQWLIEGIRDDTVPVRQAVLTRIEALFDFFSQEEKALFFDAVLFIVNYDAANAVRAQAVQVLSKFSQGKSHILGAVKKMKTINAVTRAYMTQALQAYAEAGGIDALTDLVTETIDESKQGRTFFSDALALMQEVSRTLATQDLETLGDVSEIVSLMMRHPDTTIQRNILTVIARGKLTKFTQTVQDMSQDVAVPAAIRRQARQTTEVLTGE